MNKVEDALLVITNLPDRDSADKLAGLLVKQHLAACVNQLSPCTSTYTWKGEVETAEEYPLLIKTLGIHYNKVEAAIRAHHPYELPEIIAVPLANALQEYVDWIARETGSPSAND